MMLLYQECLVFMVLADLSGITLAHVSPNFRSLLDMLEVDKEAWVDAHNFFRRKVSNPEAANMKLMSWDEELAILAQKVVKTCSFFHTAEKNRKTSVFAKVGENLYTGGDYRFTQMMTRTGITKLWYDEINFHDIKTLKCQPDKECGHYKQVIWANSYKIGCAVGRCSAIAGGHPPYLVCCNYGPAGNRFNYDGTAIHPYSEGPACSKCDPGDTCVDQLCNATGVVPPEATTVSATTTAKTKTKSTTTTKPKSTTKTTTTKPAKPMKPKTTEKIVITPRAFTTAGCPGGICTTTSMLNVTRQIYDITMTTARATNTAHSCVTVVVSLILAYLMGYKMC